MKTSTILTVLFVASFAFVGCADRAEEEARQAQEAAETKARADAARKEMETLPKTFQSRDIFKQNEPAKQPEKPVEKKPPEN